jgi:hypothetical protein
MYDPLYPQDGSVYFVDFQPSLSDLLNPNSGTKIGLVFAMTLTTKLPGRKGIAKQIFGV